MNFLSCSVLLEGVSFFSFPLFSWASYPRRYHFFFLCFKAINCLALRDFQNLSFHSAWLFSKYCSMYFLFFLYCPIWFASIRMVYRTISKKYFQTHLVNAYVAEFLIELKGLLNYYICWNWRKLNYYQIYLSESRDYCHWTNMMIAMIWFLTDFSSLLFFIQKLYLLCYCLMLWAFPKAFVYCFQGLMSNFNAIIWNR
jgi:hypothetical protein